MRRSRLINKMIKNKEIIKMYGIEFLNTLHNKVIEADESNAPIETAKNE